MKATSFVHNKGDLDEGDENMRDLVYMKTPLIAWSSVDLAWCKNLLIDGVFWTEEKSRKIWWRQEKRWSL